jgi:S1 RNA binding domain protein
MPASSPGVSIQVGQIIEGTVTGITRFGAFVALPNGQTGLVHISEVADSYVNDITDYVHENETVQVKVLSTDDRGKVALSIRQAKPGSSPTRPSRGGGGGGPRRNAPPASFEDKLARFMKDSQDRLTDLKRHTESRRGGRGS